VRISELAEASGVSIATLKYYLREGLLPPGQARGATRADYDDTHLERVRLVRTLIDVGGLSIDRVREVVTALDQPPESRHLLLGTAHDVLRQASGSPPAESVIARLAALGLPDCVGSPASTQLAQALSAAEQAGWPLTDATLTSWYAAMTRVADADVVPELAAMSPGDALRHAIVGNVLTDPVVIALRRVAQEALSSQRFDPTPERQVSL
jgi:DNA-binding transcriptional MerR regulator